MVDGLAEGRAKGMTGIKNGDRKCRGRATDRAGQRVGRALLRERKGRPKRRARQGEVNSGRGKKEE